MNAYPAVGSCFLQGQIALFPDRDNNLPPTLIICLFHDNNHSCIHISESGASLHVVRVDFYELFTPSSEKYTPSIITETKKTATRRQRPHPRRSSRYIFTYLHYHPKVLHTPSPVRCPPGRQWSGPRSPRSAPGTSAPSSPAERYSYLYKYFP